MRETDPSYCQEIYPAYFGYESSTSELLIEHARSVGSPLADCLRSFPAEKMLEAFEGTGFEQDGVLSDFYEWLTSREAFIRFRSSARIKDNVSVEDVIQASQPLGFSHLLQAFVDGMRACPSFWQKITRQSVDIRNINFFAGNATPITLRWFYNSGPNGLYVGLHENFAGIMGMSFNISILSRSFAFEKDSSWLFGYLKTVEEIETFWSVIGLDKRLTTAPPAKPKNQEEAISTESCKDPHSIDGVLAFARLKGLKPRPWSWDRLKNYNGFDHEQRVKKWQALDLAVKMKLIPPASNQSCSVCGKSNDQGSISYHSEDYGSLAKQFPICKSCHMLVHQRNSKHAAWQNLVVNCGNGTKWFESLSAKNPDVAKAPVVQSRSQENNRISFPNFARFVREVDMLDDDLRPEFSKKVKSLLSKLDQAATDPDSLELIVEALGALFNRYLFEAEYEAFFNKLKKALSKNDVGNVKLIASMIEDVFA